MWWFTSLFLFLWIGFICLQLGLFVVYLFLWFCCEFLLRGLLFGWSWILLLFGLNFGLICGCCSFYLWFSLWSEYFGFVCCLICVVFCSLDFNVGLLVVVALQTAVVFFCFVLFIGLFYFGLLLGGFLVGDLFWFVSCVFGKLYFCCLGLMFVCIAIDLFAWFIIYLFCD